MMSLAGWLYRLQQKLACVWYPHAQASGGIPPPPVIFAYTRVMLLIFIIWVVCNGCFDTASYRSPTSVFLLSMFVADTQAGAETWYVNGNDVFVWLYPTDLAGCSMPRMAELQCIQKRFLCSLTSDKQHERQHKVSRRLLALLAKLCETSNFRLIKCCTLRLDLHIVGRCNRLCSICSSHGVSTDTCSWNTTRDAFTYKNLFFQEVCCWQKLLSRHFHHVCRAGLAHDIDGGT